MPSGTGEISQAADTDEPDSLETGKDAPASGNGSGGVSTAAASRAGSGGKAAASIKTATVVPEAGSSSSTTEGDLLALLQLERLAQQATRRDYELLRKQYQRYIGVVFFLSFSASLVILDAHFSLPARHIFSCCRCQSFSFGSFSSLYVFLALVAFVWNISVLLHPPAAPVRSLYR